MMPNDAANHIRIQNRIRDQIKPGQNLQNTRAITGGISEFCATYLKSQGVEILQDTPHRKPRVFAKPKQEIVGKMPEYERGDF